MTLHALARCYCTKYADTSLTRTCPWCRGSGVVVVGPITEYVSGRCDLDHPAGENCQSEHALAHAGGPDDPSEEDSNSTFDFAEWGDLETVIKYQTDENEPLTKLKKRVGVKEPKP